MAKRAKKNERQEQGVRAQTKSQASKRDRGGEPPIEPHVESTAPESQAQPTEQVQQGQSRQGQLAEPIQEIQSTPKPEIMSSPDEELRAFLDQVPTEEWADEDLVKYVSMHRETADTKSLPHRWAMGKGILAKRAQTLHRRNGEGFTTFLRRCRVAYTTALRCLALAEYFPSPAHLEGLTKMHAYRLAGTSIPQTYGEGEEPVIEPPDIAEPKHNGIAYEEVEEPQPSGDDEALPRTAEKTAPPAPAAREASDGRSRSGEPAPASEPQPATTPAPSAAKESSGPTPPPDGKRKPDDGEDIIRFDEDATACNNWLATEVGPPLQEYLGRAATWKLHAEFRTVILNNVIKIQVRSVEIKSAYLIPRGVQELTRINGLRRRCRGIICIGRYNFKGKNDAALHSLPLPPR